MNLRRFVNKKVFLLTAAVFVVAAGSAVAMAMSGDGSFVGTSGPDQIAMGNADDFVYGQGGADTISAGNGNDTINGDGNCGAQMPGPYPNGIPSSPGCENGQGDGGNGQGQNPLDVNSPAGDPNPGQEPPGPGDTISAGNGDDTVYGGGGLSNHISVGQGNDLIYGGPYNDQISTGPGGQATIWLGPGANMVSVGRVAKGSWSTVHAYIAGDTAVDTISCGGGNVTVYANSQDKVSKGCGTPVIGSGSHADPLAARDFAIRADVKRIRAEWARAHKRHNRHLKRTRAARRGR
jgi:Ca2+-binding RTX toxin-like protein